MILFHAFKNQNSCPNENKLLIVIIYAYLAFDLVNLFFGPTKSYCLCFVSVFQPIVREEFKIGHKHIIWLSKNAQLGVI